MAKKKTGKALVIVESPAKIKTLKKFLGPHYLFESSYGHIRDLPEKDFGIDLEGDFEPRYVTMGGKEEVISRLKKAARACDTVYLCPDPDREGEAIAWHIKAILPSDVEALRATFHSLTKNEVQKAIDHPREIRQPLVDAQQARRLLDRIVGYKISPILNRRIQRGKEGFVSAGRVQSVALKLVVDREKEIEAFTPTEYWNLHALLESSKESKELKAYLYSVDGKKVEKEAVEGKECFLISNKETADQIEKRLYKTPYKVVSIERKEKKRNPVPPFITSTLQQEASRHFGFSSAKTMSIAQGLYEGVDLGNEGQEGLITYMRTDSTRIAPEALQEARGYIEKQFGKPFLPENPRIYTSKKSAQDAHEGIRPTNLAHPPETIEKYLTKEQFLLYRLIFRRFIASQMNPAIYDTITADIQNSDHLLVRATGSILKFQGFLAVYEEKEDDIEESEEEKTLPQIEEGEILPLRKVLKEQAFTRPPPRFTEASLVKELEKSGVGRPSTYVSIMNKIQSRDYTEKEQGRLKPTELGKVIALMLEANFPKIMDIGFTREMEDDLEAIAESKRDWKDLLRTFWKDFSPTIEAAEKGAFVPKVETDKPCPECGAMLQKIWYKNKYFFGCSGYPDCSFSAPIEQLDFDKSEYAHDFNWDQPCPLCEKEMTLRHGKFGPFLGCSTYPECRGIVNIPKKGEEVINPEDMPNCPAHDCPGKLTQRKSRFGKTFFSCSTFPECDVIVNSLDEISSKYPDHPRTPYVKKTKKGKQQVKKGKSGTKATINKTSSPKKEKKTRTMPPLNLSEELSQVVGAKELARGDVLKAIWEYIRKNGCQDQNDKRLIIPDKALAKIFGTNEPINMFKIAGFLSKHMSKKP